MLYYYASANSPGFQYFNGIRARVGDKNDFAAPALGINQSYIDAITSVIVNDVVNPFTEALFDDLRDKTTTGWQKVLSVDAHSTRSYMAFAYQPNVSIGMPEQPLSTDVINWLETFDKSTGWYAVHNVGVDYLTSRYIEKFSWDWNHNPLIAGK